MDLDLTLAVLRALNRHKVEYKVIGAVAMNLLGLARATKDLDVFVAPAADNIARLRAALQSVFNDPCIEEITSEDLLGDYPAIQYGPPSGDFHIDILTRLGDAWSYEQIEAEPREIEGTTVPVATARALYLMKRDTVRLRDRDDAQRLRARFDLEE